MMGNDVMFQFITRDLDRALDLNPHYTDRRHTESRTRDPWTVFGAEEKGLIYNYSDRLWQFDYAKAQAAAKTALESGAKPNTARWLTEYLSAWEGQRVELRHVLVGVNSANGYAYNVYGYKYVDK